MKIFIDTAEIREIREAHAWGIVDGVTTNPSLVAKSGRSSKKSSPRYAKSSTGRSAPRSSAPRPTA